jgi:quercetin dioxygenase-like cupin family protein
MELIQLNDRARFCADRFEMDLVHDMYTFRMIVFNFEAGQELPVHQHPADSEVAIQVLEGEGVFTGGAQDVPARPGSLLICKVSEPHGVRAGTRMRVLVTIAPPI